MRGEASLAKNVVVACVGLSIGLFCVRASLGDAPREESATWEPDVDGSQDAGAQEAGPMEDETEDAGAQDPPGDDTPDALLAAQDVRGADPAESSSTASSGEHGSDDLPTSDSSPAADAPEPVDAPARRAEALSLRRGRLAYLRCGELATDGRCPRDVEFEATAWSVLDALGGCARLASGGTGDVRFHLQQGNTEVRFRDFGDQPIPADDLLACLGESANELRTSLTADNVVVSFRFTLQ